MHVPAGHMLRNTNSAERVGSVSRGPGVAGLPQHHLSYAVTRGLWPLVGRSGEQLSSLLPLTPVHCPPNVRTQHSITAAGAARRRASHSFWRAFTAVPAVLPRFHTSGPVSETMWPQDFGSNCAGQTRRRPATPNSLQHSICADVTALCLLFVQCGSDNAKVRSRAERRAETRGTNAKNKLSQRTIHLLTAGTPTVHTSWAEMISSRVWVAYRT